MTPIGSALDLRSIWVDGQANHDPVGGAWENVAGREGREVLKEIDFSCWSGYEIENFVSNLGENSIFYK